LSREDFRADLRRARGAIEQAAGVGVLGYRAPSWSITPESVWAIEILAEEGFAYDSSIYPIHHDLYGFPNAPREPHRMKVDGRELMEYPASTVRICGANWPAAGGGYLRILPFWYTRWALGRMRAEGAGAIIVYFHPWELDPEQPRIQAVLKSRFRHYTNLRKTEPRLRRLLAAHPFERFRDVVGESGAATLPQL
jgi:polysaccharide deacetylase family protein (PEP-CTERM system associated)